MDTMLCFRQHISLYQQPLLCHMQSRYLMNPGMARMSHDKLFRFILLPMMMNTLSQLHFLPRRWLSHHLRVIQPLLDFAWALSIGHGEIQTSNFMHSFRAALVRNAHSGAGQETLTRWESSLSREGLQHLLKDPARRSPRYADVSTFPLAMFFGSTEKSTSPILV